MKRFLLSAMMLYGTLGAAEFRMPEGFAATARPEPGSWRQWGEIPLAYAAARNRVGLVLRQQGWRKLKTVELDRVHYKALEMWACGNKRILVQYWRLEVALTGVAWGDLTEEDRS